MSKFDLTTLPPWEQLFKRVLWTQLGELRGKRILDFGSGIRTFWDLQQNQACHKDPAWQEKMIDMELRVSQIPQYRDIAFFHHLILEKK